MGIKKAGDGHMLPSSRCCECGHTLKAASGLDTTERPDPGDATLCINCAGLNIFADDLSLRAPRADEKIAAAEDADLRRSRTIILAIPKALRKGAADGAR